ncbi:MAG: alpha/beta hydrolase [Planctomycetota bacterium]|nr:alpha/beta hydrolase [Planctomycetota bacterium]
MVFFGVGVRFRMLTFLMVALASVAAAAILCSSPGEVAHIVIIPVFISYVVIFRPARLQGISVRHVVYFFMLSGLVVVYLLAMAKVSSSLRVRWSELLLVIYFLASVHLFVWLIDHFINTVLSAVFRLRRGAVRPRRLYVPKTAIRLTLLIALAAPYLTATFMTHWVKFTDSTDPEQVLATGCQRVHFEGTDGLELVGWFISAAGQGSDATVILAPGRTQLRTASLAYARMLREGGYNVFLFDPRGEGLSAGHTCSFGVLGARDVLGALRYLKQARPETSRYVFGFGISHGAGAVTAAAAMDNRIKAVVLDSAFAEHGSVLRKIASVLPRPVGGYFHNATLLLASAELGCNFFEAGTRHNIARISPRPVMLVHGLDDTTISPQDRQQIYKAAGKPTTLWLVPAAGHGESLLCGWNEYRNRVRSLFESARRGAAPA